MTTVLLNKRREKEYICSFSNSRSRIWNEPASVEALICPDQVACLDLCLEIKELNID